MGFDFPKHVNCSRFQLYCRLTDIVVGEVMPVRKSHIPVLSESNFRDGLFILFSPSIPTLDSGKYKQN
jgi:hypothetical protein